MCETPSRTGMVSGGLSSPGHPGRHKGGEMDEQRYDRIVVVSQLAWRCGLAGASLERWVAPYFGDPGMPGGIVSISRL